MTTAKQIRQLLEPIAAQTADLGAQGPWLVLKPLDHVWRGVRILRCRDRDMFDALWCTGPLFSVMTHEGFGFSDPVFPIEKGLWLWSDPTTPRRFRDAIEYEALPRLRAIKTIEDLMADPVKLWGGPDTSGRWPGVRPGSDEAIACLAALGRFDEAKPHVPSTREAANRPTSMYWNYYTNEERVRVLTLCDIVEAEDRPGLAKLLRTWEEETVRRWKVEHLWEPTPFPFELQS